MPPAAGGAARATEERVHPFTTSALVSPPAGGVPRIFTTGTRPLARRTRPLARSEAGETVSPALYAASSAARLTVETAMRFVLTERARFLPYPRRFGSFLIRSRTSGRILCPARAVCPFPPLPDVFPRLPPRPTGGFFLFFVRGDSVFNCIMKILPGSQLLQSLNSRARDGEFVL